MSKRRYHRRSKMKRRGAKMQGKMPPKWLKNASQMAPKWLPGGLWAALGPRPCFQTLPGAVPERLWHGPGRPKNPSWRPWNALGAKSGSISPSWELPGRVPEGLWEVILGAFLRLGRRERKKARKITKKLCFLKLFLRAFSYRSRVCSVRLGARRRESRT